MGIKQKTWPCLFRSVGELVPQKTPRKVFTRRPPARQPADRRPLARPAARQPPAHRPQPASTSIRLPAARPPPAAHPLPSPSTRPAWAGPVPAQPALPPHPLKSSSYMLKNADLDRMVVIAEASACMTPSSSLFRGTEEGIGTN